MCDWHLFYFINAVVCNGTGKSVSGLAHIGRAPLYRGQIIHLLEKQVAGLGVRRPSPLPSLCYWILSRPGDRRRPRVVTVGIRFGYPRPFPLRPPTDPHLGPIRHHDDFDLLRRESFRFRRPRPAYRLPVGVGHRKSTVNRPAPSTTNSYRAA